MSESRTLLPAPRIRFAGTVQKLGNVPAECEDQVALSPRRFAVADGATEASYSSLWARMLTDAFCQARGDELRPAPGGWLDNARNEWQRWAAERSAHDLPWFTREALRVGTFASLIGLVFAPEEDGAWTAISCGDACVFLVRDDALAVAAPIDDSDRFTNNPTLVSSIGSREPDSMAVVAGTVRSGDAFYLATDALSQWFLAEHERGGKPWARLDAITAVDAFQAFVGESRASGALRNDDVALLSIALVFAG